MSAAPSAPHQQSATPLPQSLIAGIQGPWPRGPQQLWSTPPLPGFPTPTTPSRDQQALLSNLSTMTLQPPRQNEWFFDSGATPHISSDASTLSDLFPSHHSFPSSIIVGNGNSIPITSTGSTILSDFLRLNNVLVSPSLIKNLISVCQFTSDNNCFVEFDPLGCSVKDLHSRKVIVRCDSSGLLYPLQLPTSTFHATTSSSLWHQRLGHPSHEALSKLADSGISCNKTASDPLCHACQLGRHTHLPFHVSSSRATRNFQLIHCDLWTSPILSIPGFKYYLVVLNDCSQYLWTFPLRLKSDTFLPSLIVS
jgi:hypothetical protein